MEPETYEDEQRRQERTGEVEADRKLFEKFDRRFEDRFEDFRDLARKTDTEERRDK